MSTSHRVDDEVYAALLERKHQIEQRRGRTASMSDAIRDLLEEQGAFGGYETWTCDELVGECRARGLMVVGSKARLVDRLTEDDAP